MKRPQPTFVSRQNQRGALAPIFRKPQWASCRLRVPGRAKTLQKSPRRNSSLDEIIAGLNPFSPFDGPDIDGDGIENGEDPDVDGDGTTNAYDDDVDGDGIPIRDDDDIDGDGLLNDILDNDDDGDGISNLIDNDDDADA